MWTVLCNGIMSINCQPQACIFNCHRDMTDWFFSRTIWPWSWPNFTRSSKMWQIIHNDIMPISFQSQVCILYCITIQKGQSFWVYWRDQAHCISFVFCYIFCHFALFLVPSFTEFWKNCLQKVILVTIFIDESSKQPLCKSEVHNKHAHIFVN